MLFFPALFYRIIQKRQSYLLRRFYFPPAIELILYTLTFVQNRVGYAVCVDKHGGTPVQLMNDGMEQRRLWKVKGERINTMGFS